MFQSPPTSMTSMTQNGEKNVPVPDAHPAQRLSSIVFLHFAQVTKTKVLGEEVTCWIRALWMDAIHSFGLVQAFR